MRVASSLLYQQFVKNMQRQQAAVAHLQNQISSGKRIISPSDDPAGAARAVDLNQSVSRLEQFAANANIAGQRISLEENTLEQAGNVLQRVRELIVAANNQALQTDQTYTAYRTEIQQRYDELLNLANTVDANGDYLFAGYSTNTQPFQKTAASVAYNGDQGQRFIQISENRQIASSDAGDRLFAGMRNGNGRFSINTALTNTGVATIADGGVVNASLLTHHDYRIQFTAANTFDVIDINTATTVLTAQPYTSGAAISFDGLSVSVNGSTNTGDQFLVSAAREQSVFATLENIIGALQQPPANDVDRAQNRQTLGNSLSDLEQGINHLLEARTRVGGRLNALDDALAENEDLSLQLQKTLSNIQDVDYAKAVSDLQLQITSLQANQQSFASIQGLSLFNYIR
ncbi:MAG: flagellar hook-associated protein FlgL [Gammaproteobacteria bacterium]|nr:flagellar hook-associated protein FlgL [Gammaproteobacteria bacterium]